MIKKTTLDNGYIKVKSSEDKKISVDNKGAYSEWVGTEEQWKKRVFAEVD